MVRVLFLLAVFLGISFGQQQLQTFQDCTIGRRVSTHDGRKGTITRLDRPWSYCYVKFDDNGKEISFLYSLLRSEGGGAGASATDGKLAVGVYECVGNGRIYAGQLRILSSNTYRLGEASGRYHIESATGKIVYESGPLQPMNSKLLPNGRIGLNSNGDQFFATACDLNRNLK